MKTSWTPWLLAGALLASLQWNLRSAAEPFSTAGGGGAERSATAPPTETPASCELDATTLGITAHQMEEVSAVCRRSCELAGDLEARTEERLRTLRALLSSEQVDRRRVDALVTEIDQLRARSLRACVDSILDVRGVLGPGQVRTLIQSCCPAGATPGADGS